MLKLSLNTTNFKLNHVPPLDSHYNSTSNDIFPNNLSSNDYDKFKKITNENYPGNYAITTVRTMPWLETSIQTKKTRKEPAKPRIINEIFNDFLPYIEDPYWKDLFSSASRGKMPKEFSFKNNILTHRRKTKVNSIEMPTDLQEAISVCINFFQNIGGMRSIADLEKEEKERNKKIINDIDLTKCTWRDIRSKNIKKALISHFITSVSKKLNISEYQKKQLKFMINLGFILGYFTHEKIVFTNGFIDNINGLEWNENKKKFYIDFTKTNYPKISKLKNWIKEDEYLNPNSKICYDHYKIIDFISMWYKFIKTFDKSDKNPPSIKIIPLLPSVNGPFLIKLN